MKIGFSEKVIKIKLPTNLAGYGVDRVSNKIHDDIYVRLILFEDKKEKSIILNYDLISFDHTLLKPLYTMLSKYNINSDNVFASATHTHSAPGGVMDVTEGILRGTEYIFNKEDNEFINEIINKTESALIDAASNLSKASAKYYLDNLVGVGSNRNDRDLEGDTSFVTICLENETKKVIVYSYACHPTILKPDNIEVSSDFAGVVNKYFKDRSYNFVMFLNGSAGDISTRFNKIGKGFSEVKRFGEKIIAHIEKALINLVDFNLSITNEHNYLKLKTKTPEQIDIAKVKYNKYLEDISLASNPTEKRLLQSYAEGALINLEYSKMRSSVEIYDIDIHSMKLGIFTFIGIPGELFSELSNLVNDDYIRYTSYTNGYYGYFANSDAYNHNYYEALSSPFAKFESEKIIKLFLK